ncbi:hypothetical protein C8A01DRAFT_15707, partial [Parachaetomium inaequale]
MAQNNPNASHTPAVFRQLHIKLPTPKPCDPAPHWEGNRPSDDWLEKHPKGFLLMHNLNPKHPMGKCMLVESIDTAELFVNKRFRRLAPFFRDEDEDFSDPIWEYGYSTPSPPELRFSTLKDPRVEAQLPDEPYFTKLHACGWPMGKKGHYNEQPPSDAHSLYFQHYNGGTLRNLMEMYGDCQTGAPVPESFIWHVVEQLSRAVLYLHYGFTRAQLETEGTTLRPSAEWRCIVHRGITPQNVLLHFPEDGDRMSSCFPQVILEGFDMAGFADDPEKYWSVRAIANLLIPGEGEVPPSAWEDIYLFGEVIRRLVTTYDCDQSPPRDPLDYNVNVEGRLLHVRPPEGQHAAHSKDLIDLAKRFEVKAIQEDPAIYFSHEDVYGSITPKDPCAFLQQIFQQARVKVREYHDKWAGQEADEERDEIADVSWVMPDPTFERMPFATNRLREEAALEDIGKELRWILGP